MLLDKIKEAGIVGCGGAGFPTAVKLGNQAEYLIINAAECEPLLKTDHYVMDHYALESVAAIAKVGEMVGAKQIVIATKRYYVKEIAALQQAIDQLHVPVEIFPMDNFYPAGDEQIMIYEITGRTVPPTQIPISVGCIVSNLSTMLNIYHADENQPVTRKYLTITGEVAHPMVLDVPIGTSFAECLELAGGTPLQEFMFINGGPMMGKLGSNAEFAQQVVTKTTSGIIIMEKSGYLNDLRLTTPEQFIQVGRNACIQCRLCTEMCPRYQIGIPLHPHKIMRRLSLSELPDKIDNDPLWQEASLCSECGVCETIACPMGLMPRQVNKFVKGALREKGVRYSLEPTELIPDEMREYKKVPPQRIVFKDELQKFVDYKIEECKSYEPPKVTIPLSMHIGAPSVPVVTVGQPVEVGTLIATVPEKALGAVIHASITGVITSITTQGIVIERSQA